MAAYPEPYTGIGLQDGGLAVQIRDVVRQDVCLVEIEVDHGYQLLQCRRAISSRLLCGFASETVAFGLLTSRLRRSILGRRCRSGLCRRRRLGSRGFGFGLLAASDQANSSDDREEAELEMHDDSGIQG